MDTAFLGTTNAKIVAEPLLRLINSGQLCAQKPGPTRKPLLLRLLQAAVLDDYARFGVSIRRLLTDNGSGNRSASTHCRRLRLGQPFTRPLDVPCPIAKQNTSFQPLCEKCAYGRSHDDSQVRAHAGTERMGRDHVPGTTS
jgi:hypothetical protein